MADVLPSKLVNSVMGKLYDVLANGDETVPKSENNYLTWCCPGIPVKVTDFAYLEQGLTGVVKKEDIAEIATPAPTQAGTGSDGAPPPAAGSGIELTPAILDELRAKDTARLHIQAENVARMCDFVADVTRVENNQFARLNILNNEGSLSDIYRYILRMSQVMETELSDEIKKKIERFRGLLTVTKTKKNLIDDSETLVAEPSPLTQAYFEKMAAYESAALEYNARRVDALVAVDPRAVQYFAFNASILRNKVRAAMSDWVSNGYKNDYEGISAFIDQVMQRDMSLLKQEYRDNLEKARMTGLSSGSDYFYTALVPGSFATSSGWTKFNFSSGEIDRFASSRSNTKRWETSGGGVWSGFFGGKAKASGETTSFSGNSGFNADGFNLSFWICQVMISRPWLGEAYLRSQSWRFDENNPEAKGQMVSDGGTPPKGLIPAYPTAVIFIKDLTLSLTHSQGLQTFMSEQTKSSSSGSGHVSFGPFHLGGGYSRSSASGATDQTNEFKWDNQGLHVPGMQIAGFKCMTHDKKMPDPLASITRWV